MWWRLRRRLKKGGRGWRRRLCRRVVVRFAQGAGKEVLRIDRPLAGGFLGLTALRAEGCGIALSVHSEHILHYANWICKGALAT